MEGPPTGFWGKLDQDKKSGTVRAWHPLIDHCADVAACAEALLTRTILGRRLARLGGPEALDSVQISRLCVIAALHDYGKFNHGFQRKAQPNAQDTAGHVDEALALFQMGGELQSSFQAAVELETLFEWCVQRGHLYELLTASVAHHGRPKAPQVADPQGRQRYWHAQGERAPLAGLAELARAARQWFPDAFAPGGPALPVNVAFIHGFNGLVSLADWLGSDTAFFPYSEAGDGPRMPGSRRRAAEATAIVGLDMREVRSGLGVAPVAFDHLRLDVQPRPVQAALAELPVGEPGSLTILEAPTGEGKTEAAFLRWLRLYQAGDVDGLYFALPTRTAAQEIYKRINELVARVFPEGQRPPVIQAVPGYLSVDGIQGHPLPHFRVLWDDEGRVLGRSWAAESPKRFLAGAVVVGTIDQALLSGLQVKHAHLRAAGLLRLLLVVDEVHASDAYMTRILSEVLSRHRRAGGHALLLSATLGAEARARYLGGPPPKLADAAAAPYPLVSHGKAICLTPNAGQAPKPVRWSPLALADDAPALAAMALDAARNGAKVLIIRNTVADAIATQDALEQAGAGDLLLAVGSVPAPHHSRFAREDRKALDAAIQARFGRHQPPGGAIAVGTQTVEQSLDLDADLLLTDLAPIDVLIQRLGRLFRHVRLRPTGFESATAHILVPTERDLTRHVDERGEARGPHGLGTVYGDLRILEATWRLIEARPSITTPGDCRSLVENVLHPEVLLALGRQEPRFARHALTVLGVVSSQEVAAGLVCADWQKPFGKLDGIERLNAKVATRLGLDDREVGFAEPQRGPFGQMFKEMKMPGRFLARDLPPDLTAEVLESPPNTVRFQVRGVVFLYDRLGLRKESV